MLGKYSTSKLQLGPEDDYGSELESAYWPDWRILPYKQPAHIAHSDLWGPEQDSGLIFVATAYK